jgi:uncharacterized integral membrane protein
MVPAEAASPSRRERARTVGAFTLGGLAALFAVLNLDKVGVNWIFGTWSTPLIIVIALSFLLGTGLGFLIARQRAS